MNKYAHLQAEVLKLRRIIDAITQELYGRPWDGVQNVPHFVAKVLVERRDALQALADIRGVMDEWREKEMS